MSEANLSGDSLRRFDYWTSRARTQSAVYQETWVIQLLEEQIRCYHAALDCTPLVDLPYKAPRYADERDSYPSSIHIKPLHNYIQFTPKLDRQRVPDVLAQMVNTTVLAMDCTEIGLPSDEVWEPHEIERAVAVCCSELGSAYFERYLHLGVHDDISLQLTYSIYALGLTQNSKKTQAHALRVIGLASVARYQQHKEPDIIHFAVEVHRHALRLAEIHCSDSLLFQTDLATSLHARYLMLGGQGDLDEVIEVLYHVLDTCPSGYPYRGQATAQLANCLASKYIASSNKDHLYRSLALSSESLALRPPGHRDRPKTLFILCGALAYVFEANGELDHLNTVIEHGEEVIRTCPQGHATRNAMLVLLCHALWRRSSRNGSREDLDKAALAGQECLEANPAHVNALTCLGTIFSERLNLYGNPDDLDQLVRMRRRSLEITPPGHPNRDRVENNLSLALEQKSNYTLDTDYLDEAIDLMRAALAAWPMGHAFHLHSTFNLANILKLRFDRKGKVQDLLEAQQIHNSWTSSGSEAPPHQKYWYLRSVAMVRRAIFEWCGDPEDLNFAIETLEQATRCILSDQVDSHEVVGDLGSCYILRAQLTGSPLDFARAMDLLTLALADAPLDHPERSSLMFEMAKLLSIDGTPFQDFDGALDVYIAAATNAVCSSAGRLVMGTKVLKLLDDAYHGSLDLSNGTHAKLLEAYRVTMQLLPQVAYFGLDPHLRLKALIQAPMLARSAAACAAGNIQIESAVELLEEGRAVFWSQHLRLHTSLDDLPSDLADDMKTTFKQLERSQMSKDSMPSDRDKSQSEDRLVGQRKLSQRFSELINNARSHPGFGRFMLPDTFATLAHAAQRAPLAILIASPRFCGALIIRGPTSRPEQCSFDPNLSAEHVENMYSMLHQTAAKYRGATQGRAMRPTGRKPGQIDSLYRNLWTMIMRHVVLVLGWRKSRGSSRPRLTICSTGPFTHLPVHAACTDNEGVWDYFVPSYTPTLGVLLTALQQYTPVRKSAARLLLATVPRPFQPWAVLPHVREEVKCIEGAFPLGQTVQVAHQSTLFRHYADASCGDVLDGLPDADILHLACHGHHNLQSTLDSGFVMRDKMLTITDLMRLNLPNSFLAFLSACETAKSATAQQDQAIHLAAAMLFAGFKSVIGTMWSMYDVDGPSVAKRVYEEMFRGDAEFLEPDIIPYALDAAVTELREHKVHPRRWAPYIHLGI